MVWKPPSFLQIITKISLTNLGYEIEGFEFMANSFITYDTKDNPVGIVITI
ncbi:hypothetical protein [Candidatus Nitrosocosmicus hydrocola]|uniref:hypothetical protein n=1 Tax=Candidatus Nitrosocosmicus hydrocola TaxID=1826872 RepID=UPI0013731D22|nr:hypothetical protein [Candidatus Nitrosocosmicus hydrocola]